MSADEEKELLLRIKSERNEFGVLFDHYYKSIFGYLYRRIGTYELARDMTAETFLKAFLKIEKFVLKDVSMLSWLYGIATHEANLFFETKRYNPAKLERMLDFDLARQVDSEEEKQRLDAELHQHQEFLTIQTDLKQLDIRFQEVISLRYFEGKDHHEIGLILGKREKRIKARISNGLAKLQKVAAGRRLKKN